MLRRSAWIAVGSLLLAACGEADVEHHSPDDGVPTPRDISFASGIQPLIQSDVELNCDTCHAGGTPQNGLDLGGDATTLHAALMAGGTRQAQAYGLVVDLSTPESSMLLTFPDSGNETIPAHPKYWNSASPDDRYLTLLEWIRAGALNN